MLKKLIERMPRLSNSRERAAVIFGFLMGLILLYVLFSAGFDAIDNFRANLLSQRELLAWMQTNAPVLEKLHNQQSESISVSGKNSLGGIENSLRAKNLGMYVEKSEQLQDQKIQLTFKQVPFDTLIAWLAELRQSADFRVSFFSAQEMGRESAQGGSVDAEIVLSLPAGK